MPWHLAISTLTSPIKHESYLSNSEENVKVRKEFLDQLSHCLLRCNKSSHCTIR